MIGACGLAEWKEKGYDKEKGYELIYPGMEGEKAKEKDKDKEKEKAKQ